MATYRDTGVDLDLGDRCSQIFYEAALRTFKNRSGRFGRPEPARGGFSAPIRITELKDAYIFKNSDGVGTKVEIAEQSRRHDTIAFDLLAMVCDDAATMGAEPFALTETLNLSCLNLELVQQLARGLVSAAERARVAVVGGEIAVLGKRIGGEYIWDADVIAVLERSKMLRKETVRPGDVIIGFKERGFRSNGFSLLRHILSERYGSEWIQRPYDEARTWGEVSLTPSVIYTPVLVDAVGAYGEPGKARIKTAAHVTGGGIPGNLPRTLPEGLGARVDVEPLEPMLRLQELGHVEDREAYRSWNMGVGMLVISRDGEEEALIEIAHDHNVAALVVGEVIDEPVVIIENKGYYGDERELRYEISSPS